jgi:3-oxoacyl-[acyl-carrier-protein] synthase III
VKRAALARLCALGYAPGTPRKVEELDAVAGDAELRARLCGPDGGLRFYLDSDRDVLDLAAESVEASFAATDLARRDITAVIFASDSMGEIRGRNRQVSAWLNERGLHDAVPVLCGMGECSNLQVALSLASSLVASGAQRAVLVVCTDVARHAALGDRIAAAGAGILSDAASSAIVTDARFAAEGFDVEAHSVCRERWPAGAETIAGPMAAAMTLEVKIDAYRRLFSGLWQGPAPAGLRQVFPSNFSRAVLRTFFHGLGFPLERLYQDNVARLSHCLASDGLIGLCDYQSANDIEPGNRFVMVGSGTTQLGATLLRAV